MRTVKEVAELTGVTIRTLHHYDELRLLIPSGRSQAGYRLYDHPDLERLQEIIVWRQLGFSLPHIRVLLDDPAHDRGAALRRQRELVALELDRLQATARALDAALDAQARDTRQKDTSMFTDFDPTEYEDEARDRWGHTDAYRESGRRAAGYGEAEWSQIRAEAHAIGTDFAALMADGQPAEGAAARAVAERHRQHITYWFYSVTPAMHRNLAEMYVADPRFAATYDKLAVGLAAYVRAAILANANPTANPNPNPNPNPVSSQS